MNRHFEERYAAILTTYNAQDTVTMAITSILSQTITPTQFIIVDDHSSDQTLEIVGNLVDSLGFVEVYENTENRGQSWSRNFAMSKVQCSLIILFDDDDCSLPERAEEHLRLKSLGSDVSYVASKKVYPNGHTLQFSNKDLLLNQVSTRDALLSVLTGSSIQDNATLSIPSSTSAISTRAFEILGGFNVDFRRLEDLDLFVRSAKANLAISWSSKVLVIRHATFSSKKGGVLEMQYEQKLLDLHRKELDAKEYNLAKLQIELRRHYFERQYVGLFFNVLRSPRYWVIFVSKFKSVLRRVVHDYRKAR